MLHVRLLESSHPLGLREFDIIWLIIISSDRFTICTSTHPPSPISLAANFLSSSIPTTTVRELIMNYRIIDNQHLLRRDPNTGTFFLLNRHDEETELTDETLATLRPAFREAITKTQAHFAA